MGLLWECSKCKYRNPEKAPACKKCSSKPPLYRVWWIEYYDLNKKRRRERVGPSKRAAEIRLAQVKQELAEGKVLPELQQGTLTLSEFWEKVYWDYTKTINSPSWIRRKELAWKKHLQPFFGSVQLRNITRLKIDQYRKMRIQQGAAGGTVNRELAILKHCLNYAVKLGFLSSNPMSRYEMLPEREDAWRPLTREEAARFLSACDKRVKPIFAFCLATGLRIGNVLNLHWGQINLEERKLFIPAEQNKSKKPLVLPLSDWAIEILEQQKQQLLTQSEDTRLDTDSLVFPGRKGKPYQDLRKSFRAALKKAGLPTNIRIHDLRHTFATWAIQSGVDFRILKELLGHSTLDMALRYTHLDHSTLLEQVNRIKKLS